MNYMFLSFDFKKFKILADNSVEKVNMLHLPNFMEIGQTVAEISRFNVFENGGPPPSLIFQIAKL